MTTIEINHNEQITITTSAKNKGNKPVFMMIGKPVKIRGKTPGFPLVKAMLKFNKEEQWFFDLIFDCLNPETNQSDITHFEFNSTEVNKISRAYKPLKEMDLVKRVKKGIYMINPTAIVPPLTYEDAQEAWDSI